MKSGVLVAQPNSTLLVTFLGSLQTMASKARKMPSSFFDLKIRQTSL